MDRASPTPGSGVERRSPKCLAQGGQGDVQGGAGLLDGPPGDVPQGDGLRLREGPAPALPPLPGTTTSSTPRSLPALGLLDLLVHPLPELFQGEEQGRVEGQEELPSLPSVTPAPRAKLAPVRTPARASTTIARP